MSPDNVESAAISAGRAMLERMNNLLAREVTFAFETTYSGLGHLNFLRRAKDRGWQITAIYLWLPSPDNAEIRVARRVLEGGHNISPDFIKRRYWKGLVNFRDGYLPASDLAAVYDNSDRGRRLVAEKTLSQGFVVHDPRTWAVIQNAEP